MRNQKPLLLPDGVSALTRRSVVLAGACVPAFLCTPAMASDFWSRPRRLWLQRQTPNGLEEHRAIYFADGKLVWDEYARFCHLLRDVQANKAVQMSPVLLDILCGLQGLARANGHDAPLMTTSGYRSPATNARTEGAARDSHHMKGRAWDGRLLGLPARIVAESARYLQGGGVGLYLDRKFIHVDDGRLRYWTGK